MKKPLGKLKFNLYANSATSAPPLGSILGQRKLNIMSFCKEFNELTNKYNKSELFSVKLLFYNDQTFDIIIKKPSVSYLIKKILQIKSGSKMPGKLFVSKIKYLDIIHLTKLKYEDLNTNSLENAIKIISGTIKSMGIKIEK